MAKKKTSDFDKFVKAFSKEVNRIKKSVPETVSYVPVDIFRQTIDLVNENMRQLYQILHELNSKPECVINVRVGETEVTISGSETNKKYYISQAHTLLGNMTGVGTETTMRHSERDKFEREKCYQ